MLILITCNHDVGYFGRFAGPMFRIVDKAKRRPDLYSSEWRKLRQRVLALKGTQCVYCKKDCFSDPTIDHVIPVCQGGINDIDNLVVACRSCNAKKGGKEGWQCTT